MSGTGLRPHQRPYALGRGKPYFPRGRQLTIMHILWTRGSGTVAQVQEDLAELEEPEITCQTVQTYLTTMRGYGWVRAVPHGNVFSYEPTFEIGIVRRAAIDYITDQLFDGSREDLLLTLIEDKLTTPRMLARVRRTHRIRRAAPEYRLDRPSAESAGGPTPR